MSKHTPGPWEVRRWSDVTGYPVFAIAGLAGAQKSDAASLDANARLIAAAPEMLEALREIRSLFRDNEDVRVQCKSIPADIGADRVFRQVDAAIAKVEGGE